MMNAKKEKRIISNILEKEKTPLVISLLEIIIYKDKTIQELKDENARLKKKPKRPKLRASTIGKIDKEANKKRNPNSNKRTTTKDIEIHDTIVLQPENIPEGSEFLMYRDFIVQDIKIKPYNIRYRRSVWKTPDGKIIRPKLPKHVKGHYGVELESHVMHLYHELHVTQPLILGHLKEIGTKISAGKIDQMLTECKEIFHREKEEILVEALKFSPYVSADDTGLRHKGSNAYCTHLGNELFAYYKSTNSKTRINFIEILHGGSPVYCLNGYAIDYYRKQHLSKEKLSILERAKGKIFETESEWLLFLNRHLGIKDEFHLKKATEGALIGGLFTKGINPSLVIISDDAGQFDILWHGLCWAHSERVITSINCTSMEQFLLVAGILDDFWNLFRKLKEYKEYPVFESRKEIQEKFDEIFNFKTKFDSLNDSLQLIGDKKQELLLVLDRPEIPLTNNISERDIRDQVKKRKISAGTLSETGRLSRDTFLSLKKTVKKLNTPFRKYYKDRKTEKNEIPPLVELMKLKAAEIWGLPPPTF